MAVSSLGPGPDGMVAEPASLSDKPDDFPGKSDLMPRILSALVLAPLAVMVAWLPSSSYSTAGTWVFGIFWLIAAVAVWWEWTTLVSGQTSGNRLLLFFLGSSALMLAMVVAEFSMTRTRTPMLIIALGVLAAGVFARAERRIWVAAGVLYAGALLTAPILLRRDAELGLVAILFLFALVWATDIAGYFTGRAFGGPKLAPSISPNKTWSGAIGGAIGGMLGGGAVAALAGVGNLPAIALVALGLSAAAQAGDLFESAIKRRFGAKDAGRLIPGHGGVMDRLDGFIAAVAVAVALGITRADMDTAAQGLLLW
ncbi:MAG: phosphatidate cytidylyltransferase [Alphaproteobacteria bacterium]|nr:phosphatidate cytidylyltransferase [Alphaproteobacteria bacterium]